MQMDMERISTADAPTPTPNNLKKNIKKKIDLKKPEGVSDQVWSDLVSSRKTEMSQTAIDEISREASLAGWTLEAAIREMCHRGWAGFKAEWVMKGESAATGIGSVSAPKIDHNLLKTNKAYAAIAERLGEPIAISWFTDSVLVDRKLLVGRALARDWIRNNYLSDLKDLVDTVTVDPSAVKNGRAAAASEVDDDTVQPKTVEKALGGQI